MLSPENATRLAAQAVQGVSKASRLVAVLAIPRRRRAIAAVVLWYHAEPEAYATSLLLEEHGSASLYDSDTHLALPEALRSLVDRAAREGDF